MKYTAQSTKYVFKNFFYIFPFAVFPAFLFSVSTDENALINVLTALFEKRISDWKFFELFRAVSFLNFSSWKASVFGFIGLIVLVLSIALFMALLDKHFRFGKRTYNGIFSKLNDNFVSTCGYTLLLFVMYELWSLIAATFLFFSSRIPLIWCSYLLSGVLFIILHIMLLYAVGSIYLWLPCMQITGFRSFESLRYSYQLVEPVKWKILLGQIAVLLSIEALIVGCIFALPNKILLTVATTFLYAIVVMIYCVRMQITYFERDNLERVDLLTYYKR